MKPRSEDSEGSAEQAAADTVAADGTVAISGGSARGKQNRTLLAEIKRAELAAFPVELPALPSDSYALGEEVARGGMGRVVRAFDQRLGRVVALKLLLGDSPYLRARFAREAQITAGLQHPSIVPIYEAGTWPDGNLAYAMKLVSGRPLEVAIESCATLEERLALLPRFIDVVDAVAYAHSERVVHRDIKPSNIILGEFGETILIDWGVAKSLDVDDEETGGVSPMDSEANRLTAFGAVVGTPVYMPPEQAAGETIGEPADVYSLGAVLYHLLAGRLPYTGVTPQAVLRKVVLGPPTPLADCDRHIPAELIAVVARAMAREPQERYSAAELAAELRRFTTGKLVAAYHYSARERFVRWVKRHRASVLVAGAALAILLVVAAVSARRIISERDRAQESDRVSRSLLAAQYAEQGRVLVLSGDRLRALTYLLAAARAGARGPALDLLLARAAHSVEQKRHDLIGHKGPVPSIAFDRSGDRVISAGDDGTARLWDPATGRMLNVLTGHTREVNGFALAPDRDELTTFGRDGSARIWDLPTGAERRILRGSESELLGACYRGDGARIATAAGDGMVRVYDSRTGAEVAGFRAHDGLAREARFDADGRIWTAGEDGAVALWQADGSPIRRWSLGRGPAMGIAMSGAHTAVLLGGGQVAVWSSSSAEPRLFDLGEELRVMVRTSRAPLFIDGGRRLAVPVNRSLQVIDLASWRRVYSLSGHGGEVSSVSVSADGRRLATASSDGAARVWNAADGRLLSILQTVDHVRMVAFSPRGELVATAGFAGGVIWAPADDPPTRLMAGHREEVYTARFDPTGKRVVSAGKDGTLRTWDAASGRQLAMASNGATLFHAAFDPSGSRIITADQRGVAAIWNADTLIREATLAEPARAPLMAANFGPGGVLIATASDDGNARIWDARSRALRLTLPHDSAVNAVEIDPSGRRVVTATQDGTARVWDARSGVELLTLRLGGIGLTASFSPDGTRIVVTARRTARIYDSRDGRLVVSLEGHQRELSSARFASDQLVVTSGFDSTVKVWDALTGRELASFEVVNAFASWVDADPTARRIVSADYGGDVIVWELAPPVRRPAELEAQLEPRLPFRVQAGVLVPRTLH